MHLSKRPFTTTTAVYISLLAEWSFPSGLQTTFQYVSPSQGLSCRTEKLSVSLAA